MADYVNDMGVSFEFILFIFFLFTDFTRKKRTGKDKMET